MGTFDAIRDFFRGGAKEKILQAAASCHIASFTAGREYLAQRGELADFSAGSQYLLEHMKSGVRQNLINHATLTDSGMVVLTFEEAGLRLPLCAEVMGEGQDAISGHEAHTILYANMQQEETAPVLSTLATCEMDSSAAMAAVAMLDKIAPTGRKELLVLGQIYMKAAKAIKASEQLELAGSLYRKADVCFRAANEGVLAGNACLIEARICRQIDGNALRENKIVAMAIERYEQQAEYYYTEGNTRLDSNDLEGAFMCFQKAIDATKALTRFNDEKCTHTEAAKQSLSLMRECLLSQTRIKRFLSSRVEKSAKADEEKKVELKKLAQDLEALNLASLRCEGQIKQLEADPIATLKDQGKWGKWTDVSTEENTSK